MSQEWNDFYNRPSMMDRSGGDGSKMYQYIQGVHLSSAHSSSPQAVPNSVTPVSSIHAILQWANQPRNEVHQAEDPKTKQLKRKK